jgi:hypothetical protein
MERPLQAGMPSQHASSGAAPATPPPPSAAAAAPAARSSSSAATPTRSTLEVLETLTPSGAPACFVRGTALLRPGIESGDVVAWVDPATRQPYGVVRVCGGGGSPPGGGDCAPSPEHGPSGGAGERGPGEGFALALLDAASPGFRRGSCWLEVFRQGDRLGFRSAAAGGRFLQARRRGAGGGADAGLLNPGEAPGPAPFHSGGGGSPPGQQHCDATGNIEQQQQHQQLFGSPARPSAAAAGCSEADGQGAAAFAQRLARSSRLAFFNENMGVYEQFEVLPPPASTNGSTTTAGSFLAGGEYDPLERPWQRARVLLRSRLLPHIQVDIEVSWQRFDCWGGGHTQLRLACLAHFSDCRHTQHPSTRNRS